MITASQDAASTARVCPCWAWSVRGSRQSLLLDLNIPCLSRRSVPRLWRFVGYFHFPRMSPVPRLTAPRHPSTPAPGSPSYSSLPGAPARSTQRSRKRSHCRLVLVAFARHTLRAPPCRLLACSFLLLCLQPRRRRLPGPSLTSRVLASISHLTWAVISVTGTLKAPAQTMPAPPSSESLLFSQGTPWGLPCAWGTPARFRVSGFHSC